ncbi:hypothetical protein [Psychromonas aquatilis]|uniref:HEPN domain-containing protein n=1 Tax=Psychromonas aquatilis TaxID=2005072 RepID=A0ABU9GTA4_9GAMM
MNPELKDTHKSMLELGLAALAHANWHANYYSCENHMWSQLSVLQAAHAAEILIKARIAQEHPLLIFEQLPKSTQVSSETLDFAHLVEKAKTIQYFDLPERLWAATGIKLQTTDVFKSFGNLRNCLQHFADPCGRDCAEETIQFIYKVIDPFINQCWGLCAVDHNEDSERHIYLIENLIRHNIEFLVSEEALSSLQYVQFEWSDNQAYKYKTLKRLKEAGFDTKGL